MTDRIFDVGAMLVGAVAILLLSAAHGAGQAAAPAVQGAATAPLRDRATTSTGTARIRAQIVRADTGAPLPRAQVMLTGEPAIRRQVIADVEGRYEFADLPAGRFTVSATKGGYVTLQYGQTRPFVPDCACRRATIARAVLRGTPGSRARESGAASTAGGVQAHDEAFPTPSPRSIVLDIARLTPPLSDRCHTAVYSSGDRKRTVCPSV